MRSSKHPTKGPRGKYDYGSCDMCGSAVRERTVKQDLWIKDQLVVLENVRAGVCTQCGHRIVRAAVGRQIAALVADTKALKTKRSLKVPVVRLPRVA